MATYQYRLTFIPRKFALENCQLLNQDSETFEDVVSSAWIERKILFKDYETFLHSFTSLVEWSKKYPNSKDYGNNDSDDLSIYLNDEGYILEFTSRFDLRKIDRSFIDNVLSLASQFDCLALDEKGNLANVNFNDLIQNIENSNAYKFVQKPTEFLKDMTKKD